MVRLIACTSSDLPLKASEVGLKEERYDLFAEGLITFAITNRQFLETLLVGHSFRHNR